MNTDEKAMLDDATRRVLASTPPTRVVEALSELGWFELRGEDRAAVEGAFFQLQGECLATSGVLDLVVLEALGVPAAGLSVVHPVPGAVGAAAATDGTSLEVDGLLAGPGEEQGLVVPLDPGGHVLLAGAVTARLEVTPVEGLDPQLGWRRVRGRVDGAGPGVPVHGSVATVRASTVARRALAHELIGLARHMSGLAVEHVTQRRQFGRPIGSFQAVHHRLSEVRVALEVAEQAVGVAWTVPDDLATTMAKILAGTAARLAAKQCQQVMGGMGFTWEHPLHRYVRRAVALDALHGSSSELTSEVGAGLAATGQVPGLVQL